MKVYGMHPSIIAYLLATAGIAHKHFGIISIWLLRIFTSFLSIICDRLFAISIGLMIASTLLWIDSSIAPV